MCDLSAKLVIAEGLGTFKRTIGNEAVIMMQVNSEKVRRYFERAFVRWVFNAIRRDKDPFENPIEWSDFVSLKDVNYLLQKEETLRHIDVNKLDWTWITTRFKTIHARKNVPCGHVEIKKDESRIFLRYIWSEDGWRRPLEYSLYIKRYEHIRKVYQGPSDKFHEHLLVVFARYSACGSTNNHCSAPPSVILSSGAKTELFGSPVNTITHQYCSPFKDVEKYFGSLGSFFDFRLSAGIYFMNPPYDEDLILAAMQKIVTVFQSDVPITIIMVLPVWDVSGQEKYRGRVHVVRKYEGFELLQSSGFIRSMAVLDYQKHLFFDYYENDYKSVTDAYLIVASNTDYKETAQEIADRWLSVVKV